MIQIEHKRVHWTSQDWARPRTALGIKPDGKLVIAVVDGDTSTDAGLRIDVLAQVMIALGCESAMNLDGGGSSCLVANGEEISGNPGTRRLGAAVCFWPKNRTKEPVKLNKASSEHLTNPRISPVGLVVHTTANRNKVEPPWHMTGTTTTILTA